MRSKFRRYFLCFLTAFLLLAQIVPNCVLAADDPAPAQMAEDISTLHLVKENKGFNKPGVLFDGNYRSGRTASENAMLTLESEKGKGSL